MDKQPAVELREQQKSESTEIGKGDSHASHPGYGFGMHFAPAGLIHEAQPKRQIPDGRRERKTQADGDDEQKDK